MVETRVPRLVGPGWPRRYYYECERRGTANAFTMVEPMGGSHHVAVTERRTKVEFTEQIRQLADVHYPEAERIRVVMHSMDTHKAASFYEGLPLRGGSYYIVSRSTTPKDALAMADIELSVFPSKYLNRRILDRESLE